MAYTLFIAAVFCPSFLALFFLEPKLVMQQLLVAVLAAAAIGVLGTALCTLGCFNALADPNLPSRQMAFAGASSLALGSAVSLVAQTASLFIAVSRQGKFYGYASMVVSFAFGCAVLFQLITLILHHRRKEKSVRATAP